MIPFQKTTRQTLTPLKPPCSFYNLLMSFTGSSFDGFNDRSTLPGAKEPIFLFRKAQALVADLHRRLKDKNSAFAFEGSSDIVCLADSQFATLLHGAGLVSAEKGSFSSDQLIEAARAASVVACQHVQSLLKGLCGVAHDLWFLSSSSSFFSSVAVSCVFYSMLFVLCLLGVFVLFFSQPYLTQPVTAPSLFSLTKIEPHSGAAVQQAIAKHLTANKAEDTKPSRRFESTNSAHF